MFITLCEIALFFEDDEKYRPIGSWRVGRRYLSIYIFFKFSRFKFYLVNGF